MCKSRAVSRFFWKKSATTCRFTSYYWIFGRQKGAGKIQWKTWFFAQKISKKSSIFIKFWISSSELKSAASERWALDKSKYLPPGYLQQVAVPENKKHTPPPYQEKSHTKCASHERYLDFFQKNRRQLFVSRAITGFWRGKKYTHCVKHERYTDIFSCF